MTRIQLFPQTNHSRYRLQQSYQRSSLVKQLVNSSYSLQSQLFFHYFYASNRGSFFVIGVEAMFDLLPNTQNTVNVTNTTITPGTTNTTAVTLNNRWVTMATGKLGYAWDRVLLYGKGGGAWVGTSSPGLTVNNVPASFTSTRTTRTFWRDCRSGRGMGFCGQLVGASRVGRHLITEPEPDRFR